MFNVPSATALKVVFKAFLASDHITPATGKTIAITISKNGAAFGNPSAGATNAAQIANGWYYVDLSTTDTGTVGPLAIHGTEGTIDPIGVLYNVMAASSGLIDVNAELADGAAIETGTAVAAAVVTAMQAPGTTLTTVQADTNDIQARLPAALVSGKMDASVSALATGAITSATFAAGALNAAAIATDAITAAKIATDAVTEIQAGLATSAALTTVDDFLDTEIAAILAAVDTEVAAIKTKTDFLPSVAAGAVGGIAIVGSAMTLSTAERDATAAAILNLANGVMTGYSLGRSQRVFLAALAGKVAISGATVNIRDMLDGINAIVATTTADGQRTAVTINQT